MSSNRLEKARCLLLTHEPWYGHVAMNMTWIETSIVRTMGVRVVHGGDVQCLYNPLFVKELTVPEICFVIQHEVEHVVRCHCLRNGLSDKLTFNVAADMVVNGSKSLPRIGITTDGARKRHIPCRDELIWLPHCWSPNENTEYYYRRLVRMRGDLPDGFVLDDHSLWEQSDLSEEEFRIVARSLIVDANKKTRGNMPGHLRSVVEQLDQSQIPWPALLRRYLNQSLGQRRTSYSRRHRRRDEFGVPGTTRRRQAHVSVIVDVSGSVSHKELGRFFGEMEKICSSARTDVLLWDCEFRGFTANYRHGDWEKFTPDGGGGTDMAAPVEWLDQRKLVGDCVVILTDGHCNWPVKQGFGFIAVISGATVGPTWGRTVYLAA